MKMVLLNSGGIDSRVAAAVLYGQGHELHSLRFDFGNGVPGEPAAETASRFCADHVVLTWPTAWAPLNRGDEPRPARMTLLLHALGASYAAAIGADGLASGVRQESRPGGDALRDGLQAVLDGSSYWSGLRLIAPLWDLIPDEVDDLADELGVDLSTTYSCYTSPPCGECHSCHRRAGVGL